MMHFIHFLSQSVKYFSLRQTRRETNRRKAHSRLYKLVTWQVDLLSIWSFLFQLIVSVYFSFINYMAEWFLCNNQWTTEQNVEKVAGIMKVEFKKWDFSLPTSLYLVHLRSPGFKSYKSKYLQLEYAISFHTNKRHCIFSTYLHIRTSNYQIHSIF